METAYLHIVTNHIPIVGIPLAAAVLIIGIWRKSEELKMAGFLILTILGLATIATFLLGQGGEDFVEELAGVSHDAIENHEGFAKYALAAVIATAMVAAFGLLRYKGLSFFNRESDGGTNGSRAGFPNLIVFLVLTMSIFCGGLLGYTGKLGGMIRHSEFYGGAAATDNHEDEAKETEPDKTKDDDDGGKRRRGKN